MNKGVFALLAMGCLLLLVSARATEAQLPGTTLRANIPFAFNVGNKALPAGEYQIRRINDAPEGLVISSLNNRDHAMFVTEGVQARTTPRHSELVFHHYGDTYYLSQVFTGGEPTGRELPESHSERTMRRQLARSNQTTGETVALVAY